MATCNNVSLIYDSECIGESLIKINTNFTNLDSGLCQLGQELLALDAFVKSLSAKDSPTIDMTFSAAGYFLSADVVDDSLGTVKLGVDIPTTTKQFLTAAKISSLTDANISNPQNNELLVWNGAYWVNRNVEDRVGAKFLNELGDVSFPTTKQNNEVLKYSSFYNKWINGVDDSELVVRDGNYVDITVSNNGKNWNINPAAVGSNELAPGAVTTSKIALSAITNEKIANKTIELDKCAFSVGEVNTGKNIGVGYAVCVETNQGTQIPIKKLKPAGAVSISDDGSTLTISVPTASVPIGATGSNLGTGVGIYSEDKSTSGYLKFKKLKAGTGITLSSTSDEITIAAAPLTLGLSLIGVTATGTPITDNSEIASRINSIYPASSFPDNTVCRVEVTVPQNDAITSLAVSVPFTIQYKRTGDTTKSTNFELLDPPVTEGTKVDFKGRTVGNDIWTGSKTLNGTATLSNQPTLKVPTRQIKEFKTLSGLWVFVSNIN
jgi:hypothetical protein